MTSGIYIIRNILNNKLYVGSSINIGRRLTKHFSELRRDIHYNKKMQRSFNKHGEGSFESFVAISCDQSLLLWYEQQFIDQLKPEYNILPSAGSPLGYKHPKEFGEEISRRNTGKVCSVETKKKIGAKNRLYKHTPEAIEKIRKTSMGRIKPSRTYAGFISPDGIEYREIHDLTRFCQKHSLNYGNMNQVANGHKRIHLGWKRLDECTS